MDGSNWFSVGRKQICQKRGGGGGGGAFWFWGENVIKNPMRIGLGANFNLHGENSIRPPKSESLRRMYSNMCHFCKGEQPKCGSGCPKYLFWRVSSTTTVQPGSTTSH